MPLSETSWKDKDVLQLLLLYYLFLLFFLHVKVVHRNRACLSPEMSRHDLRNCH